MGLFNSKHFIPIQMAKTWVRYGLALMVFLAIFGIRYLLLPLTGIGAPFLLFLAGILFTTWCCGFGPGVFNTFLSALSTSYFYSIQTGVSPKEGLFRWVLFLIEGLLMCWIASDVFRSKHEKEEQLELIFSQTPDHIIIQDKNLKYLFVVNPQLGFTPKDMIGKTDYDFLEKNDADELTRIKTGVIQTAKPVYVQVPLLSTEGKQEYFEGSYVPKFDSNGKIDGLIGYFKNVTERKRSEELQRTQIELEKADRAKDQFLAILSHELRTPLTSILMWAQLLKRGGAGEEKTKTGIQAIEDSARVQNQLINDLLDISRIKSGKLVVEFEPVNVLSLLLSSVESIRPSAEKKSIQIYENHTSDQVFVSADSVRLKQVFWNLLSNAVKFTPNDGKINVTLDVVEEDEVRKVRVRIQDTGKGISSEFLPRLFQRFSQQDSSNIRAHGGLGLGLSLVRSLLDLLGGSVEAASPGEGLGSTFTVKLPLIDEKVKDDQKRISSADALAKPDIYSADALSKLKILVVDDDQKTREVLLAALTSFGAQVRLAASAREAFEMLEKFETDVLVSDIGMPEEDGYSLIRRVRATNSERKKGIPAIALTAFVGHGEHRKAISEGYQAHLSKPVDAQQLVRAILEVSR